MVYSEVFIDFDIYLAKITEIIKIDCNKVEIITNIIHRISDSWSVLMRMVKIFKTIFEITIFMQIILFND